MRSFARVPRHSAVARLIFISSVYRKGHRCELGCSHQGSSLIQQGSKGCHDSTGTLTAWNTLPMCAMHFRHNTRFITTRHHTWISVARTPSPLRAVPCSPGTRPVLTSITALPSPGIPRSWCLFAPVAGTARSYQVRDHEISNQSTSRGAFTGHDGPGMPQTLGRCCSVVSAKALHPLLCCLVAPNAAKSLHRH